MVRKEKQVNKPSSTQNPVQTGPDHPNSLTILRSQGSLRLCKSYFCDENGRMTQKPYDNAKHFDVGIKSVHSIEELYSLLCQLEKETQACLIRGKLKDGFPLQKVVRRSKDKPGNPATFEEVDRSWLMCDLDQLKTPFPVDPSQEADLLRAAHFLRASLPFPFRTAAAALSFSSGAFVSIRDGQLQIEPYQAKAHLFFLLDSPVCGESFRVFAKTHGLDPSLGGTIQPHYTAAPLFQGIDDPLIQRTFLLEGDCRVEVKQCQPPLYNLVTYQQKVLSQKESQHKEKMKSKVDENDGLKEKILCHWDCLRIFDYHGWATHQEIKSNGEIYLKGNNGLGLHVDPNKDCWYSHGDQQGGGPFEAWSLCTKGISKVARQHFYSLLCEMAQAAGIEIPPQSTKTFPTNKKYLMTDLGNAERMVDKYGEEIRYCYTWQTWLVWNGKHWEKDHTGEIERKAKSTALQMLKEATDEEDDEKRKTRVKHALNSTNQPKIKTMIDSAKSEAGIPIRTEEVDRHLRLLNVLNGTLDFETGKLRSHQKEDYLTKMVSIPYEPEATCPLFFQFLAKILDGNEELLDFIQRAVGYSLTGLTVEQCLFILHGEGQNGKSTLIDLLMKLLGPYAKRTPTEMLMMKRGDQGIPNDLARLVGTRLVTSVETEDNKRLAEVKIKEMTGGDQMTARFLHQEFFDFTPQFKLWLATNHKPVIKGTDHAIWRRIRLIPFNVQITEEEKDPFLGEKLQAELPGILAWAVEGYIKWKQNGLQPPATVIKATNGYREEMDLLAAFLAERCMLSPLVEEGAKELYQAYKEWCEENGEKIESQKKFGGRLTERGLERFQVGKGRRMWKGIALFSEQKSRGADGADGALNSRLEPN